MLICPDCRKYAWTLKVPEVELDAGRNDNGQTTVAATERKQVLSSCENCAWSGKVYDGMLRMMPSKTGDTHLGYGKFYERLAEEDLSSPIMEQDYAAALNENTALALGDLRDKQGCDLGVGKGHLLRELLGRGAKMTAVDIAISYLEALVGYGDMRRVQADAEYLPFRDEFDFLTCTDVMEHVLNPGNLLYCINEALKSGGVAAIRIPADENLLLYSTHLGCNYEMVHLRTFSEGVFKGMLEGAGLKVHSIEPDGQSLSMLLPDSYDDSPNRRNEIDRIRELLTQRGLTAGEFMKTPAWFKNILSKPYFYLAIAEKTHRIKASADQGFVLEPVS